MFKKNTAVTGFPIGHFINATTGDAVTTGTLTCKRILDGTGAACENAASYNTDAAQWEIDLDAADTNGDMVGLSFTLTDCLPISFGIRTGTKLVSELNDVSTAQVNTEADTALSDVGLTTTVTGRIDAAVSTRSSHSAANVKTAIEAAGSHLTLILEDTGTTLPDAINALPSAAAINYTADETGYTLTAGTLVSGTVANTAAVGTPMVFAPTGAVALDVQFEFELATARPSELIVRGYYDGGAGLLTSKYASVYAYDYAAADWDLLSDAGNRIASGSANAGYTYVLAPQHQQDATGTVLIRYVSSRVDATDRLYLDQQLVSGVVTGATVGEIAEGVWLHNVRNRQLDGTHRSAGYFLARTAPEWAGVTNVTGAVVTMTPGDYFNGTVGTYAGRLVQFHKNGENIYEMRRVVSQAADGALTLDQAPVLVESSGWHGYVLPDLAVPGVALEATAQAILTDTNELQTNQGDWATANVADLALEATAQDVLTAIGDIDAGGLDAAGVREALGMDAADLDDQLGAIQAGVDSVTVELTPEDIEVLAAALAGAVTGTGSIPVDADTLDDAEDDMYFQTSGGAGIGGALVSAFLTSEYDAGLYELRGYTTTLDDGSWKDPLMLNALQYTIVFSKTGLNTATTTVTPAEA